MDRQANKSIIGAKLDYNSIIYGSANNNVLNTLDPIHNAVLRIISRVFKTNPI